MAIKNRRGDFKDFKKESLEDAEFAVVLSGDPDSKDGKSVYLNFGNGIVKRLVTEDEIQTKISGTKENPIVIDSLETGKIYVLSGSGNKFVFDSGHPTILNDAWKEFDNAIGFFVKTSYGSLTSVMFSTWGGGLAGADIYQGALDKYYYFQKVDESGNPVKQSERRKGDTVCSQ